MNLEQLLDQLSNSTLTPSERARLRCRIAKELEESGDYEGARRAMGELWQRVGERPDLEGLDEGARAEVLLRVGVLTGWIGSVKQMPDAQETAKDLITEAVSTFERLGDAGKVDEAQTDLAYCYWRQGRFDEARVILQEVLKRSAERGETRKVAVIRSAIVERSAKRYHDALRIQTDYAPLFDEATSHALRAKFHNGFAITLDILGTTEQREDYVDRAFVEYTAAGYHFEQAGHFRYCACVENNLAMLYLAVGKFTEAHAHIDRARSMFASLKDSVHIAQVDETRAKALLAEGRDEEAERVAAAAVRTLEKGDEQSLLAEALTTHGVSLARTGRRVRARLTLQRAVIVAEQAGDKASAGRASLAVIEELSDTTALAEVCTLYEQAAEQLSASQRGIAARLVEAARIVIRRFRPASPAARAGLFSAPLTWKGFSLRKEVRRYERFLIECALRDADGAVTRAARLLGYKHHYSLIDLLNKRHQSLLPARSPVVPRGPRKGGVTRTKRDSPGRAEKRVRPLTILHVEDDKLVAEAVKDTLEMEGWHVVMCGDGAAALKRVEGDAGYDLLIVDNRLPHVNGLEIVRYVRQLPHRRWTPVVMLSGSEVEGEARAAGVDVFLRKPQDVGRLVEAIEGLIRRERDGSRAPARTSALGKRAVPRGRVRSGGLCAASLSKQSLSVPLLARWDSISQAGLGITSYDLAPRQ